MLKKYILDTSVLIYHPAAILEFPQADVIIPLTVLEELDKLKVFPNEVGKNARSAIRILDSFGDQLASGVILENKSNLKVELSETVLNSLNHTNNDNRILTCALKFKNQIKKISTILVSRDLNLRIKARAFGILAQDYQKTSINTEDLYLGFQEIIDPDVGYLLPTKKEISLPNKKPWNSLFLNQCVVILDKNKELLALGKRAADKIKLIEPWGMWGLVPRNSEQILASDLLMDPKIPLVTLIGKSGTGKSILALAAALTMVLERKLYQKLIIYKPMHPIGNDIGFLPGILSEKLEPWMESVNDNLDVLANLGSNGMHLPWQEKFAQFLNKIELQPLTYIRGRSLPKSLILLEEGQGISLSEMKTLLTRLGEGSKIIITGDIEQIDNPDLDPTTNGLTHIIEKLKDSELTGHITLLKGQRSALASLAANTL